MPGSFGVVSPNGKIIACGPEPLSFIDATNSKVLASYHNWRGYSVIFASNTLVFAVNATSVISLDVSHLPTVSVLDTIGKL